MPGLPLTGGSEMERPQVKAYFVYAPQFAEHADEATLVNYGQIVFARNPGRAKVKSEAWREGYVRRYTDLRAVRRLEYDCYADQRRVPVDVLIQDGWQFFCARCGGNVTEENLGVVIADEPYCEDCRTMYGSERYDRLNGLQNV
jgi:hypothetical protein